MSEEFKYATITLAHHGLEFRGVDAQLREDRPLADEDVKRLQSWAQRYQAGVGKDHQNDALLQLGQEMQAWLNGPTSFLSRLLESAAAPLLVEFVVGREENEPARAFLDAPWELLASEGRHWALREDMVLCPVRRIGKAAEPPAASPQRLGLVFMAAAPRGADNLDFEGEEASILTATKDLGLDLTVEESGTLSLLSACVAREKPDVVQISCHGTLEPEPGLLLEDDVGDRDFVKAGKLVMELAAQRPRLLFLSACETAEANPVLPSLARSLVRAGVPAVLGWAAPVRDNEATLFASLLYRRVTKGEDLACALAYTRLALADSDELPEPSEPGPRSHDWHLARLYFSPIGAGALATANGPQRYLAQGRAVKTFLDTKRKQVPVAAEAEFVGRRREIQKILREFRAPAGERHAGAFIHGVGRQGKSSLAARVGQRLEHSHELLVLYGRYDGQALLGLFRDHVATPAVTTIVNRCLPEVEKNATNLLPALTELLEGPCRQAKPSGERPILLVIDDFEQALDARQEGHHVLKPEYVESIRAVLLAFNDAQTESRLLFTCRFQFTLPHDGQDLTDFLLDVPLHGMDEHESRKQAGAKLRVHTSGTKKPSRKSLAGLVLRLDRIIGTARGNPGLQDLLFTLGLQDPKACDRCLDGMNEFLTKGKLPTEDKVRAFLENLALRSLTGLLSTSQRELLRCLTLFELPVPVPVMERLAPEVGAGDDDLARLVALGLWEVYEDLFNPQAPALAVSALVRPLAGTLTEAEQQSVAHTTTLGLFEQWGAEEEGDRRGVLQEYELTRLALLAREACVLAASAAWALRLLDRRFEYRKAARWAKDILAIVDAAGVPPSVDLLRTAAERCVQVGYMTEASAFRQRALALIEQATESGEPIDLGDHAATFVTHARALADQGRPDEALRFFERARDLLPESPSRAAVRAYIAEILVHKGRIDEALKEFTAAREAFAGSGRRESEAGAIGSIAKILATKGEVDAALALHQERLAVFESLGDKRSWAVTLGDIARLRAAKGEVDAALALHQERLAVYESLGATRERAVALGDIARLREAKGEVDAALALQRERLATNESLGDADGIAAALYDIAQIELGRQNIEAAFEPLARSYVILQQIGRLDGICIVGKYLGQILCAAGQQKEGLEILERSRAGFLKLGQADNAAGVQSLIDELGK